MIRFLTFLFALLFAVQSRGQNGGNESLSGSLLLSGNAALLSFPVTAHNVQTFQGGTNGQHVSTQSLTSASSQTYSWGPGTYFGSYTNGYTNNAIDATLARFDFDNTTVPPSPYTTWYMAGQSPLVLGPDAFTLRYNNITNFDTNVTEEIYWLPPDVVHTNISIYFDFCGRQDSSSGGANSYDFLSFIQQYGTYAGSFNWKQGVSSPTGSTLGVQAEVGSGSAGLIPIATNHWYRGQFIWNGAPYGLAVWDLQNSLALVGTSFSNYVPTALGPLRSFAIGQHAHAANAQVQGKSYVWIANVVVVTNALYSPSMFAVQFSPEFERYIRQFEPVRKPWSIPKPLAELAYDSRRRWIHREALFTGDIQ